MFLYIEAVFLTLNRNLSIFENILKFLYLKKLTTFRADFKEWPLCSLVSNAESEKLIKFLHIPSYWKLCFPYF